MATNKEIDRMQMVVELAIERVRLQINMLPAVFSGSRNELDPDTGLRKDFLQLRKCQSRLIEISTNLTKQHLENYQKERSNK